MENQDQNINQTPPESPIMQVPPISPVIQSPPPVSSQINTLADGPKSKLPILIIGIILFLLIAGSAAGFYIYKHQGNYPYLFAPKPPNSVDQNLLVTPCNADSIETWKTHTENGITFKYPPDVNIVSVSDNYNLVTQSSSKAIVIEPNLRCQKILQNRYQISIWAEDNKENFKDANGMISKYVTLLKNTNEDTSAKNKIQKYLKPYKNGEIDGIYTILGFDYDFVTVLYVKNDKIYTFQITGDQGSLPSEQSMKGFDQILSTFKFTGQNQTTGTSTWKTYTNSKYGYSLQYPSNWNNDNNEKMSDVLFSPPPDSKLHEFPPYAAVRVIDNSKNLSPEEYANTLQYGYTLKFEPIKISNVDGVKTLLPGAGDGYEDILIKKEIFIYVIHFSTGYVDESTQSSLKNAFSQILSTFKFTN